MAEKGGPGALALEVEVELLLHERGKAALLVLPNLNRHKQKQIITIHVRARDQASQCPSAPGESFRHPREA